MTAPERAQAFVFGEVAEQYDAFRPDYPEALFDAVMEYGELRAGDAALEIGAGTGKATLPFLARGLRVHALEPSPGMAALLRTKGADVEETTFDAFKAASAFELLFGAQSWHWVHQSDRYDHAADVLASGGTFAMFWNQAREWDGPLGADNDAVYERLAPELTGDVRRKASQLDWVLDELRAHDRFRVPEKRIITWTEHYTRAEYVGLLGTHSHHLVLPDAQRIALHEAVGDVIDARGGRVEVVYDTELYLSRRV